VTGNLFTLGVFWFANNISSLQIIFKGSSAPNPQKVIKPKFCLIYCIRAWRIKNALRSTIDLAARRSMADSGFRTPSTVLFLTVGGGGVHGMVIKKCAQIYGCHGGMQMDGLQAILDPPDRFAFNSGGGGGNEAFFFGGPYPNVSSIHCAWSSITFSTFFIHLCATHSLVFSSMSHILPITHP
jgi:hypothetical protein